MVKDNGYAQDDLKAIKIFDVIHPDCKDHCMSIFQRVMAGETVDNIEASFITKDGRKIEVEGNINVRFMGGGIVATQGIFRDVTERKYWRTIFFRPSRTGRTHLMPLLI